MKVGFIGTGHMGEPMAANVLAAEKSLFVHDSNRKATSNLEASGADWCESLAEVASSSEVVLLSLPGPREVEAVGYELINSMSSGQTLVDMSTNSPTLVKRIAKDANQRHR